MSTDVNFNIKGTTNVPEQVDKSKKAMSEFERQSAMVTKKFTEFGKDFILGFMAPMVLLHSAINFITAAIEKRKQEVQEALDFATTAEAKLYASQTEIEAARRANDQRKAEEDRKKAEEMKLQARIQFFKETPAGLAAAEATAIGFRRFAEAMSGGATPKNTAPVTAQEMAAAAEQLATQPLTAELQAAFDKFFTETAAQRPPEGTTAATAQNIANLSSNTVGVGMNAQFDMLNQQVNLQTDMANSLRQLVERDQADVGFRPSKYPDFGGSTQSGRSPLPPR
jgi:hypothetical protein